MGDAAELRRRAVERSKQRGYAYERDLRPVGHPQTNPGHSHIYVERGKILPREICPRCDGIGKIVQGNGTWTAETPCPACGGSGRNGVA